MERKQKGAGEAQRKELVNEIGSKVNKPKSKWCGNWVKEDQKI